MQQDDKSKIESGDSRNIDVRAVSTLAKLALSEEEIQSISKDLDRILEHFEKIKEINCENVKPLVNPNESESWLRNDDSVSNTDRGFLRDVLEMAPQRSGQLFKVPPVV